MAGPSSVLVRQLRSVGAVRIGQPTFFRVPPASSSRPLARGSPCPRLEHTSMPASALRKQDLFFTDGVQGCLVALTGLDYEKVFKVARRGQDIVAPSYAFLTDQELEEARTGARERALRKHLQMPPVMEERASEDHQQEEDLLEDDPAIQGYDSARLVFTDITFGIHDRDRLIVVREPDGRLRRATGSERDRLNQIYFPKKGRKVRMPPLFEPDHLARLLHEGGPEKCLHVLDRNCVQFEPDHPVYVRTASAVYDHVNDNGHHRALWSTRHYGPYVFHLVWNRNCDDLIVHYLMAQAGDLNHLDPVTLVLNLYRLVHQHGPSGEGLPELLVLSEATEADQINQLRSYVRSCSRKPVKVQAALETLLETQASNRRAAANLEMAHGTAAGTGKRS